MTQTESLLATDLPAAQAAERLRAAAQERRPCAPVRDLIGETDVARAYVVQRGLNDARIASGATVVGRKVGLTSRAVQLQLGVDQPDFGVLFDDMDVTDLELVPIETLLQPKVEAEIAFVLSADLDGDDLTAADVRSAVAYACAALEIVDSRVTDWDIRITDTVADNASSGLFVLGTERVSLDHLEPRTVAMTLAVDGEPTSHGSGEACLGDPLNALLWLARTAQEHGAPLRAGQVILAGALGPMVAATPGSTVTAVLSGLGTVSASFSSGSIA